MVAKIRCSLRWRDYNIIRGNQAGNVSNDLARLRQADRVRSPYCQIVSPSGVPRPRPIPALAPGHTDLH